MYVHVFQQSKNNRTTDVDTKPRTGQNSQQNVQKESQRKSITSLVCAIKSMNITSLYSMRNKTSAFL